MVHKKYTYKDGKRFGPYYYETKRVDGNVVTTYLGTKLPHKKIHLYLIRNVLLIFAFILVIASVYLLSSSITGNASLDIKNNYKFGEQISGSLELNIFEGELIPAGSIALISYGNYSKEFILSDIVSNEKIEGRFYAKGTDISGEGFGYGLSGKIAEYPTLNFQFKIFDENSREEDNIEEDSLDSENNLEITAEESSELAESEESLGSSESESSETISPESSNDGASITGAVISDSNIHSGTVSKDKNFIYDLSGGKKAYLVEGSVYYGDEKLEDEVISFEISENEFLVTTDYSIEVNGFGEDYLGKESVLVTLDLNSLGIIADQEAEFSISLVYDGQIIVESSESISISSESSVVESNPSESEGSLLFNESSNQTIINGTLTNETLVNQTQISNVTESNITQINQTIIDETLIEVQTAQYRAVIGKPVKWVKTVSIDSNESLNLTVEIPSSAENITVNKIYEDAFEEIDLIDVEENFESDVTLSITGDVTADIDLDRDSFLQKIFKFFSITGRVVEDETETQEIFVEVLENDSVIEVEYYTEAPIATEESIHDNFKKVLVSSPEDVHYENVLVYTSISDSSKIKDISSVKIEWAENNSVLNVSSFNDTNSDGYIDYIEWIAPHLSNQTFNIILIISALHFDENRNFISDIYNETRELDGFWSESIPDGHFVRVTFEINLTSVNDITIFPRAANSSNISDIIIEVYEKDSNYSLVQFSDIIENEYNKVFLTSLNESQDTFDLLISGGEIEFDHIIDPSTPISISNSTDGLLAYIEGSQTNPRYRWFNKSSGLFGSELSNTIAVGAAIEHIWTRCAPNRLECALLTADSADDLALQFYSYNSTNGLCWHNSTRCAGTNYEIELTLQATNGEKAALEYENGTGELLIVWANTSFNGLEYALWNGTAFSIPPSTVAALGFGSGSVVQVESAQEPGTNNISIVFTNNTAGQVMVWNGDSNTWGCASQITNDLSTMQRPKVDIAHEQVSGDLFAVFGLSSADSLRYLTKPKGSCTYTETTSTTVDEHTDTIRVAPVWNTDRILITADANSGDDAEWYQWTGTDISANDPGDTNIATDANGNELITGACFTTDPRCVVAYADAVTGGNDSINWAVLNATADQWATMPDVRKNISTTLEAVRCYPYPMGPYIDDKILCLLEDDNNQLTGYVLDNSTNQWSDTNITAGPLETSTLLAEFRSFTFDFVYSNKNFYAAQSQTFPSFSNFNETTLNNSAYVSGALYRFNATITGSNGSAGFEFNGVNRSVTNLTATMFNSSVLDLAAGTYSYYWWAYGDAGGYNVSSLRNYVIAKNSTPILNLTFNGTQSNTYRINGSSILINGSLILGDSSSLLRLYKNGTQINQAVIEVSNSTLFNTLFGTYNITVLSNESQNYTQGFRTYNVTILPNSYKNITLVDSPGEGSGSGTDVEILYSVTDLAEIIIVQVVTWGGSGTGIIPDSVTFDGGELIRVGSGAYNSISQTNVEIYYGLSPSIGDDLRLRAFLPDSADGVNIAGFTLNGINLTDPLENYNYTNKSTWNVPTYIQTSAYRSWLVDTLAVTDIPPTAEPSIIQTMNQDSGLSVGGYKENVLPGYNFMNWSWGTSSQEVAHIVASFRPSFDLDTTPPKVNLNGPANNSLYNLTDIVNFNWTTLDDRDTSMLCNLTIGAAVNQSNVVSPNNTATNVTVGGFPIGSYLWNVNCYDDGTNQGANKTRVFTVLNLIPYNGTTVTLNTSEGTNRTFENLNVQTTLLDLNNHVMNVTVRWYNNSILHLTQSYDNNYANGSTFTATLDDGNTTKGHNWTVGLTISDGLAQFNVNSSALIIRNTPPNVTLISPANNSITLNRTDQIFTWVSSDDDEDTVVNSKINISLVASSTCTDSGHSGSTTYGVSSGSNLTSIGGLLSCLIDNGDYYTWSVESRDDEDYGPPSNVFNLSVQAYLNFVMNLSSVEFGNLGYLKSNDTSDNSPKPIVIINEGNVKANVTFGASSLWKSVNNPSIYYTAKVDNASTNGISENLTFLNGISAVNYINVPLSSSPLSLAGSFNYTDNADTMEVDLNVTVPSTEGPGLKNSTITFTFILGHEEIYA